MSARDISTARKRRGVIRASLTRLNGRLKDLETRASDPDIGTLASQMMTKLESLDADFRTHHLALIDLIDDEEALGKEQEVLDELDDELAVLSVRIKRLVSSRNASPDTDVRKVVSRRLNRLKKSLSTVREQIGEMSSRPRDACLIRQREEQVLELKKELGEISSTLLSLDLEDTDELMVGLPDLEEDIFERSLQLKRMSQPLGSETAPSPSDSKGVRLPKIDVPVFDGNILNWITFWEQFSIAVHHRSDISNSEKLVYLRHAVQGGSAKGVIEGLSHSGEQYTEAVECLRMRYNRPRLIHQAHVRKILEASALKDGNGRELRRLHDIVQQHLRALKSMGYEPSGPFITSVLELKLDTGTMFEWQKHSHEAADVPHYRELLEFINLRAQASETSVSERPRKMPGSEVRKGFGPSKPVAAFAVSTTTTTSEPCALCKTSRHPLYACSKFKSLPHDKKMTTVKDSSLCLNCLRSGHFVRQCKSLHRCRDCQRPHHTLLHQEAKGDPAAPIPPAQSSSTSVQAHAATGLTSNSLLMTCQVLLTSPGGSSTKARALLDSASSTSFVSERLARALRLPRSQQSARISGIAGLSHGSVSHPITNFLVSPLNNSSKQLSVSAIIVPRVTCDLPIHPVPLDPSWGYLGGIQLADPSFGRPGAIDVLLGVDVFAATLLQGRRAGPSGRPVALETEFGWVLVGTADQRPPASRVVSCHVTLSSGDDLLRKFWEVEEPPTESPVLSAEEKAVVHHFKSNHFRSAEGRFAVPLPKKTDAKALGESRSQAVRRFLTMERSLHSRNQFAEFAAVVEEYFTLGHAEQVPIVDLQKPTQQVFYLPMHTVRKESSTTTKIRVVFDASAKSTSGVSFNDTLMVGPNIHPPLVDVLLRFRLHQIALTADVSKMYRAVELVEPDRDFHRFVWRSSPGEPLVDYRMTRATFGVSASSFAANMSVKQNAMDFASKYPLAAKAVDDSIYVDDCLTGADTVKEAIGLQSELQNLFSEARFLLRKWNSSEPSALEHLPSELKESHFSQTIPEPVEYPKTLGIEWNAKEDFFRLTIAEPPNPENITKRVLTSDIAKTFDVLGWFSPTIIKAKILLQKLWERKIDWDEVVPQDVMEVWWRWRSELQILSDKHMPRCYFPKRARSYSTQLHGFCDASENAYAAVVYLRTVDTGGTTHISLVTSKTRVAPLKRLTIPRLELCGAHLLSQILSHVCEVLNLPQCEVYAWTDSTVVLGWLSGDPRRFKIYVANRVSRIVELVASDRWKHVSGIDNPADCASRGLFPSELLQHDLWWNGPGWLLSNPSSWPQASNLPHRKIPEEEREICLVSRAERCSVIPLTRYSSFTRLKRVTAWMLRFIANCRVQCDGATARLSGPLSVAELTPAETHWFFIAQSHHFHAEIEALKKNRDLPKASCLRALHPFLDSSGLLRVGGRVHNTKFAYSQRHPVILHGQHDLTRLIVRSEHVRLLHAGPTLINSSLSRRFHIIGRRNTIRTITRSCVTCRRTVAKPQPQIMGQLPLERVTPGIVFEKVGIDYAGPMYLKLGHIRKPTIVKSYVCVFVALSVKAIHLELVSELTSAAFIACLRRFIARRGKPSNIWSDHGSNFIGANRELSELAHFLQQQKTDGDISEFCSMQKIQWSFIPEHAPHFGGLWESAVKSLKTHLKRIVGNAKLTFEEFNTILTQVEACLNSRPLVPLSCEDDGIEALTPGHFLIGRPLESLPDPPSSYQSMALLRRWNLCQTLTRHFWQRWSTDYFASLRKFTKWHHPGRNARVGDIVLLHEDGLVPTRWPLGRIISVHPGRDDIVRVVTVKTTTGVYKRPMTKVALLLPLD